MAEDPGEIREAIEQTRREIGETVEALGQKADVKGRATAKVKESAASANQALAEALPEGFVPLADEVSDRARKATRKVQEDPKPALIAAGVVLVLWLLARRRRRR